jgi:hypothetical protein
MDCHGCFLGAELPASATVDFDSLGITGLNSYRTISYAQALYLYSRIGRLGEGNAVALYRNWFSLDSPTAPRLLP